MTTWNYRVFREPSGEFVIREVYYSEDGRIISCTQDSVEPYGMSFEELARDIEYFREALDAPVLTLEDIPEQMQDTIPPARQVGNLTHEQLMPQLAGASPSTSTHTSAIQRPKRKAS